MSREIKFRHWKTLTFIGPDFMDYEPEIKYQNGKYGAIIANFVIDFDNLMQYTGLKDKNGKEIYEGDIVKDLSPYAPINGDTVVHALKAYKLNILVIWSEHEAKFKLVGDWTEDQGGYYQYSDQIHDRRLEVIGNIYENPELLETEKKND